MLTNHKMMAFAATTDAARAKAFYEGTLGLKVLGDDPFALALDAGGTQLRIQKVEKHTPPPFTVLGWHSDDIARDVAALTERGVKFERFPGMQQDAAGVWSSPSGAKIAWFKDPDGNTLSLAEGA